MTSSNPSNEKAFFDVHTTGYGFLKRIREVTPKGKNSGFLACTISAISGSADNPVYRYFDVRISGANAKTLVSSHKTDVEAGRPVLVAFRIGDVYPDVFIRTQGIDQGKASALLKGRLLSASTLDTKALKQSLRHPLVTHGLGYLKHIACNARGILRYCTIAMLNGPTNAPQYRYVDATVLDQTLVILLNQFVVDIEAKRKVLFSFQLEDLEANFFIRTRGENAGEPVAVLKSTLSAISMIKVDGKEVYRAPTKATGTPRDYGSAPADDATDAQQPTPHATVAA